MDQDTTTTTPTDVSVWEDVLSLDQILTRLNGTDLAPLADGDVDGLLLAAEEAARKLPLLQQALARQVRDRGLHTDRGARSVESYLRTVLRIDHSDAKARVAAIDALHPRVQPSGDVLPAKYPVAAAAVTAGEISTAHAWTVTDALDALPAAVTPRVRDDAEQSLVDEARQMHPSHLKRVGEALQAVLNPDGYLDTENERKERRGMRIGRHLHGMHRAVVDLDPESANDLMLYIEPLARPEAQDDGTPDPRTAAQRRLDALLQLVRWGSEHKAQHSGCDSKPLYCDVHHVQWWSRGGDTDIDNSALYCGRHHRLLHQQHWRAAMLNGIPHTIPPGSTRNSNPDATGSTTHRPGELSVPGVAIATPATDNSAGGPRPDRHAP